MSADLVEKIIAAMQGANGLPALEQSVTSILDSITAGKPGKQALVGRIIEDFSLTQRVLKLANSPMYTPFAEKTASVSSALDVLGTDGLMHIALGTSMMTAKELAGDANLSRTLLASEVARNACPQRFEDAAVAGHMYDLGRLVVNKFLPEEAAQIEQRHADGEAHEDAVKAVLGMSLQELGAAVAKRWNLPNEIISIIDGSGDDHLVNVAKFSTELSSLLHVGKLDEASQLVSTRDLPGMDKSNLASLVERKGREVAPIHVMPRTDSAPAQANAADLLGELHETLSGRQIHTMEELAEVLFPAFGKALQTAHCLLFMAGRAGDFSIRCGTGKSFEQLRDELRVSAEFKPTAFHAAIKNNVDVSITDVGRLKASALPDGYRRLLQGVRRFLVLPIANGHVAGLLYCDWEDSRELHAQELDAIRQLRDLFLPFLPA